MFTFLFEQQVQFLPEERTEPYNLYGVGVPQGKIVHDAKKLAASLSKPENRLTVKKMKKAQHVGSLQLP